MKYILIAVLLMAGLSPAMAISRSADDNTLLMAQVTPQPMPPGVATPLPTIVVQQPAATFDAPATVTVQQPKETVAFGDYAGSLLNWLAVVLLPVFAPIALDWYVKLRARLGLQTTDAQRAKFQQTVENGVALGAHDAQVSLSGKLNFDVKNKIMADAVAYAKAHGADTLKALGVDPTSPEAEEAIRARAAKMFADLDQQATAVQAGVPATPPSPLASEGPPADALTTDKV